MTTATEYADGLRQVADWLEAHPDIDMPSNEIGCFSMNTKEQAARVLMALKPCNKVYGDSLFSITRQFGPIILRYYFNRNQVCTPRVVGTKVVPARPERLIEATPEHVVEVIEWDCEPILPANATTEAVTA